MPPESNPEVNKDPVGQYNYQPYRSEEEFGPGKSNASATLMVREDPQQEFEENQEERCAILLCLDRSSSMSGQAIEELDEAVRQFTRDLNADPSIAAKVDIGMIKFNGQVDWEDFINSTSFDPPKLTSHGGTKIAFAMQVSLDMCEKRKDAYRQHGIPYHRPWIVLITDGLAEHDTPQELADIRQRTREAEESRRAAIFTIACGRQADELAVWLDQNIAPPNRRTKKTTEANFKELFKWLSNSQIALSKSTPGQRVDLPSTDGWEIV